LDASCQSYIGCPSVAPVSMCLIPKLGHAWPGTGSAIKSGGAGSLGPYRPELDSTSAFIDFFLKY
jgi:polyhydroxybutyrate depolymerase